MPTKRNKNQIRRSRVKQKKLDGTNGNDKLQKDDQIRAESTPSLESLVEEDKPELQENVLYLQYQNVFNRFNDNQLQVGDETATGEVVRGSDDEVGLSSNNQSDSEEGTGEQISRKKLRKQNKLPLASLKSFSNRPQVIEWFDADARDPYILVSIKSQLNVVPVPAHWSSKREYLSSRRGIEKPAFQLPDYIRSTGIQEMRNNENNLSLRQLQREKVQPKSGRLDIDYQKLHDAFFKFQTKPRLLGFGDVYYEGRETVDQYLNEAKKARPGVISKELRAALGLPENNPNVPPPWIANMKILGKPPAYANMVIPGLDCEYSADGYKSPADFERANESQKTESSLWGSLENVESSDEVSESDAGDDDSEQSDSDLTRRNDDLASSLKGGVDHNINKHDSQKDTPHHNIEPFFPGEHERSSKEPQEDEAQPKELYTVIEPEGSHFPNGLFENKEGYKFAKEEGARESGPSWRQNHEGLISEGEDDLKFTF